MRAPIGAGLRTLLHPTARQTDLMRACLWSGDSARAAWIAWCDQLPDLKLALADPDLGSKALLALLDDAVRRNELASDTAVRGALRVAGFAEERRVAACREASARAYAALADAAIPFLVLKGDALADIVYPAPQLRHSHDVDVMIRAGDAAPAAAAIAAAGFAPTPARSGAIRFEDTSGLPLELHTGACRLASAGSLAEIWQRAVPRRLAGVDALLPSPADHLAHVLAQAGCCNSRDTLIWIADSWYLIAGGLDWDVFATTAERSTAALVIGALLAYLAAEMRALVPERILARLARPAGGDAHLALLDGIRAGRRGRLRHIAAQARGRERIAVVRWAMKRAQRRSQKDAK